MSRAMDKLAVAGFAPAIVDLAAAIGQHAGCNLSGAAIVRSRSAACRLYVTQAQDVLRDLHMPALEVLRAARMAVHEHILFDGPHDRPTALLDHAPTQDLFAAVLGCTGALVFSHVDALRQERPRRSARSTA